MYLSLIILIKQHINHLLIQIYLPVFRKLIYYTCKRSFIRSQCVLVNFVLMRYYQVGKRLILFIFISITTPLTVYKQFNLSKWKYNVQESYVIICKQISVWHFVNEDKLQDSKKIFINIFINMINFTLLIGMGIQRKH